MPDRTRTMLQAAIHALDEVVAPAVDPEHPLALEQLGLVTRWLDHLESHIDLIPEREWGELALYRDMGERLLEDAEKAAPTEAQHLAEALRDIAPLLKGSLATAEQTSRGVHTLTDAISAVVRATRGLDTPHARAIRAVILRDSEPLLDLNRAWFVDQGWEPDRAAVPDLTDALNRAVLHHSSARSEGAR